MWCIYMYAVYMYTTRHIHIHMYICIHVGSTIQRQHMMWPNSYFDLTSTMSRPYSNLSHTLPTQTCLLKDPITEYNVTQTCFRPYLDHVQTLSKPDPGLTHTKSCLRKDPTTTCDATQAVLGPYLDHVQTLPKPYSNLTQTKPCLLKDPNTQASGPQQREDACCFFKMANDHGPLSNCSNCHCHNLDVS